MKNRPPNVFLSSTMYDLSELRAQLRQFIEGLGWRAVMSEHDSFPIDANQTTVENSRRNVRENADVFVMVVGARYGSVDAEADKSVTNLEFVEARTRGVPVYVFVNKDVLAQLRCVEGKPRGRLLGRRRHTTDIRVHRLVARRWRVLDVRIRHRRGHRERPEGDALMLALRRDQYWEIRLFATVLEEELDRREPLRREIEHGLASDDVTFVDIVDLGSWALDRLDEVQRLVQTASTIVDSYMPQALGEDGVPGDPIELVAVARRLAQVWEDSARWSLRCRSVRVDDRAERVVDLLANVNAPMLDELWEFAHSINPRLNEAIEALAGGGPSNLNLVLTLTADVDELVEEIAQLEAGL